jgi:hypothetical protein
MNNANFTTPEKITGNKRPVACSPVVKKKTTPWKRKMTCQPCCNNTQGGCDGEGCGGMVMLISRDEDDRFLACSSDSPGCRGDNKIAQYKGVCGACGCSMLPKQMICVSDTAGKHVHVRCKYDQISHVESDFACPLCGCLIKEDEESNSVNIGRKKMKVHVKCQLTGKKASEFVIDLTLDTPSIPYVVLDTSASNK